MGGSSNPHSSEQVELQEWIFYSDLENEVKSTCLFGNTKLRINSTIDIWLPEVAVTTDTVRE